LGLAERYLSATPFATAQSSPLYRKLKIPSADPTFVLEFTHRNRSRVVGFLAASIYCYAGALQASLLAKDIPYLFIGGVKLLESAHVRDLLSALRLVANPKDEIGWMRFLTLWKGVGDVTASGLIEYLMLAENIEVPKTAVNTVALVRDFQNDVAKAVAKAYSALEELLAAKYKNQDWDKRRNDFAVVAKLSEKHSSILEFIGECDRGLRTADRL
jgi:superfamily I DNA/RNA helicase